MNRVFGTLLSLLTLCGCAQHLPLPVAANADAAVDGAVNSAACAVSTHDAPIADSLNISDLYLLTVIHKEVHKDTSEQLLLQTQTDGDEVVLVAMNPLSMRLFSGKIQGQHVDLQTAPHYRGVDPHQLIWAYSLWQQQDLPPECWLESGYQLVRNESEFNVFKGRRLVARWWSQQPDLIELTQAKLQITLKKMGK